eukprot:NODE_635_length_1475_cov_207.683029_g476_i0.p1 GENE.NODE_635_length_1475_cov_207.683029_g476_i0~~NODE_635_length_1475_cov_207.683029_g476_i0.p1  ORF type:complete len:419 (-),score=107.85 NODE_635_length_1475_cov_207.683029_g476_i0:218-1318(-)
MHSFSSTTPTLKMTIMTSQFIEFPFDCFAWTACLEKLLRLSRQSGASPVFAKSQVCRLHQRHQCSYGKECRHIHICREGWARILDKYPALQDTKQKQHDSQNPRKRRPRTVPSKSSAEADGPMGMTTPVKREIPHANTSTPNTALRSFASRFAASSPPPDFEDTTPPSTTEENTPTIAFHFSSSPSSSSPSCTFSPIPTFTSITATPFGAVSRFGDRSPGPSFSSPGLSSEDTSRCTPSPASLAFEPSPHSHFHLSSSHFHPSSPLAFDHPASLPFNHSPNLNIDSMSRHCFSPGPGPGQSFSPAPHPTSQSCTTPDDLPLLFDDVLHISDDSCGMMPPDLFNGTLLSPVNQTPLWTFDSDPCSGS